MLTHHQQHIVNKSSSKKMRDLVLSLGKASSLHLCAQFCLCNGGLFSQLGFKWGCFSESPAWLASIVACGI